MQPEPLGSGGRRRLPLEVRRKWPADTRRGEPSEQPPTNSGGYVNEPHDWQRRSSLSWGRLRLVGTPGRCRGSASNWSHRTGREVEVEEAGAGRMAAVRMIQGADLEPFAATTAAAGRRRPRGADGPDKERAGLQTGCLMNYVRPFALPAEQPSDSGRPIGANIKFKFHPAHQKSGQLGKISKSLSSRLAAAAEATIGRSPSNRRHAQNCGRSRTGSTSGQVNMGPAASSWAGAHETSGATAVGGSRSWLAEAAPSGPLGSGHSPGGPTTIIVVIRLGGRCRADARCVFVPATGGRPPLWSEANVGPLDGPASSATATPRRMTGPAEATLGRAASGPGEKRRESPASYLAGQIAFCLAPAATFLISLAQPSELGHSTRSPSSGPRVDFKIATRPASCDVGRPESGDIPAIGSINMIDGRRRQQGQRWENEIDSANVMMRNRRGNKRDKCDTDGARLGFDRVGHALWPMLTLLLLVSLLLVCGPRAASSEGPAAAAPPKRAVWARALGVALPSDESAVRIERLADRLANWPDQQQATLFYLSLLARNSRAGDSSASWCRARISLGPLLESPSLGALEGELRSAPNGDGSGRLERRRQRQQHEHDQEQEQERAKLMDKLGADSRFVDSAKLAVENANLISRLLIHQESQVIRHISSQKRFFNYLLETKLKSQAATIGAIDALGLVFLSAASQSPEPEPLPSPPANEEAESSGSPATSTDSKRTDAEVLFAPVSRRNHQSKLAESQDLSAQLNNKSSPWNSDHQRPELFGAWIGRLQVDPEWASSIGERLMSTDDQSGGLDWRDGRWLWPRLDCGLSNKWILTYSVPFFGVSGAPESGQRAPTLRGVAYVNLDLGRLGLVDQCASQEAPVLFGNTHRCASRLKRSQCLTLPPANRDEDGAGLEFRGGNYVCQCPSGSTVEPAERRAVQEHRARLAGILIDSPGSASPLDRLVLEPEDERLTDKVRLGARLLGERHQQSLLAGRQERNSSTPGDHYYFLAGAQLDADAALEWFARASRSDQLKSTTNDQQQQQQQLHQSGDSIRFDWPEQVCRRCGRPSVGGANSDGRTRPTQLNTCEPGPAEQQQRGAPRQGPFGEEATRLDWFRPLVLALQSICTLATLGLVGILFRLRKSRVILVSGWLMLETTLLGALILYASVFVRYFEPTSLTCLLEPWLRELGFSIFYGSILIKLYRILTDFQTRKTHRVCLRDKDQVVYLLAITLIVVGYMSAWTALMMDGFLFGGPRSGCGALNGSTSTLVPSGIVIFPQALAANDSSGQTEVARYSRSAAQEVSSPSFGGPIGVSSGSSSRMVDQLAEYAPEQLRALARNLDSFGQLFSGLLERTELKYDESSESFVATMRCRKLNWDYVTELSEMGLLVFGVYLVYKLRNARGEVHKEKLNLSAPIFVELLVSGCAYSLRHALWRQLSPNQLLALYFVRCQLTVTVGLALVFGPKLWTICQSKPSLFRQTGPAGQAALNSKASARHRCHLSCELHDHHLNDAVRLHQAMLSNSALDIGSIDLADMDPDEIQAELKRVYAQLEILKTKVMRRDNPHISKRRGGRKTSHRKFSLQAFHAHRHTASCQQQQQQQSQSPSQAQQSQASSTTHLAQDSCGTEDQRSNESMMVGQTTLRAAPKLSVLLESGPELGQRQTPTRESSPERPAERTTTGRRVRLESAERQPRVGGQPEAGAQSEQQEGPNQGHRNQHRNHQHRHHQHHHHHHHHHGRHHRAHHAHHHHHHHQQHQQQLADKEGWTSGRKLASEAEPNSAGSVGIYLDDETDVIMNDSQSSENVSPQRNSSFVCSQSSIHPDDSSLN